MRRGKRPLRIARFVALVVIVGSTLASATTPRLGVPLRTQEHSNWCWAGSSQMLLAYYGIDVSRCEIASYSRMRSDCCAMPRAHLP